MRLQYKLHRYNLTLERSMAYIFNCNTIKRFSVKRRDSIGNNYPLSYVNLHRDGNRDFIKEHTNNSVTLLYILTS